MVGHCRSRKARAWHGDADSGERGSQFTGGGDPANCRDPRAGCLGRARNVGCSVVFSPRKNKPGGCSVNRADLSVLAATAWEPKVSIKQRMQVMLDHARQYEAIAGLERFRSIRKHLGWYCTGFPHAAAMRAKMFQVTNAQEVERVVADCCSHLMREDIDLAETTAFEPQPFQPCAS